MLVHAPKSSFVGVPQLLEQGTGYHAGDVGATPCELLRRRGLAIPIVTPANHPPIRAHAASVRLASTDGFERAFGRRGLLVLVAAPTSHCAVHSHTTRVTAAHTNRLERACWRCSASVFVVPPAE